MTVVSDSSPLITLARIGQLQLLADFFGRIVVPAEVHNEVAIAGCGLPGSEEVRKADWIDVRDVPLGSDPKLVEALAGLGAGERQAIMLAKALSAGLLLVDEWKARRLAQKAGLSVAGCLGILEAGARIGKISNLRLTYIDLLKRAFASNWSCFVPA